MIAPGQKLKTNFKVKVVRDGGTQEAAFKDLLTRRTVVSVYMRNNTSACDRQIASLAQNAKKITRLGVNLIAISRDTCSSHAKYAEKMGVSFTLVSDPDFAFSKHADAMVEKSMYGRKYLAPARADYVLDPDGTVVARIEKIDPRNHATEVIALLQSL